MSNFFDNLPAFYAYAVILSVAWLKGFVLPFQKASFLVYKLFYFRIFLL